MKLTKRIRTVLYEDQKFAAIELELLHTPAFQRLYDLHQLGLTDRVFIDASHSRLHHVVGVVEQATNLMRSLARNLREKPTISGFIGRLRLLQESTTNKAFPHDPVKGSKK